MTANQGELCFIGVDVGTQSVRAALVTDRGRIVKVSSNPIVTWNPLPDHYEQSSVSIWKAVCTTVKSVSQGVPREKIVGIGFDGTCSLVALDDAFEPLSISTTGLNEHNVILWMDHRAKEETNDINATSHPALSCVGGRISLEMEIPKLMWIKKHLPDQWRKAGHFFDLPDFLTWKATGSLSRSLCSLVCKWCYQANPEKNGWDEDFLMTVGLADLAKNDFCRIGNVVLSPGEPCGNGLTESAADDLGLLPETVVGTSIIDAHAGGIGMLGCQAEGSHERNTFSSRLSIIAGTSSCHMVVSNAAVFVPGVWGPYYSAMVPKMWLNEAGQSVAGKLLDHITNIHPATKELKEKNPEKHIHQLLNEKAYDLMSREGCISVSHLTKEVHVWPDFHGNRSPIADPTLRGMISGLTLSSDEDDLIRIYVATVQALGYGTRYIIASLERTGHSIDTLLICGGLAKNELYVKMHADITGLPVLLPNEEESVLLGSAILGAIACGRFHTMEEAMLNMGGKGKLIQPNSRDKRFHDCKYEVFFNLLECQRRSKAAMERVDFWDGVAVDDNK